MPSPPDGLAAIRRAPAQAADDDGWVAVMLTLPLAESEQAIALLERFVVAGAVVETPFTQGEASGPPDLLPQADARVVSYVPSADWPALREPLRAALDSGVWAHGAPRLSTRELHRDEWERASQAFQTLIRVGRVVVRPPRCAFQPQPGEVVVTIESGLAFGTGHHESTRLVLSALQREVRPGARVLDFGSGSGILACAAARLGAARVDALDQDPLAVQATRHNAALNDAQAVIEARQAIAPPAGAYDVVLANITAAVLEQQMPGLAAATRPGGVCLLGGIIEKQIEGARRAAGRSGLEITEIEADGEWRALRATRPASVSG